MPGMTTTETIRLDTIVDVTLSGFGRHLLEKHLDSEAVREFEDSMNGGRAGDVDRRPHRAPYHVPIHLWEVFHIFGPHVRSSLKWPVVEFTYEREASDVERLETANAQLYADTTDALRNVLVRLGASSHYQAPELLAKNAAAWLEAPLPTVPNAAGPWWLGDEVVRVVESHGHLWVRLGNNRRKHVREFEGWQGPALKDPRVIPSSTDGPDDEDIPF